MFTKSGIVVAKTNRFRVPYVSFPILLQATFFIPIDFFRKMAHIREAKELACVNQTTDCSL